MPELLVTMMRFEHSPRALYLSQVDRSKLRMFYSVLFHQEERLKLAEKRREKKLKQDLDAEGHTRSKATERSST